MPRMPDGRDLQITYQDEVWAAATLGNAAIVIVGDSPTLQRITMLQTLRREMAAKYRPFGGVVVVLDGAIKDARFLSVSPEDLMMLFRPVTAKRHGGGNVVALESRGFVAAGIRALFNGLRLAARSPHPMQFVETREEACAWLAPKLKNPTSWSPSAEELLTAVNDLAHNIRVVISRR
jgi:hypothetical protein